MDYLAGNVQLVIAIFGGYSLFFSLFQFPPKIVNTMLFVSSWPQLVTSSLGIILALLITKRTKN